MHGIILVELRQYVTQRLGKASWNELLKAAGLDNRVYFALDTYPDAEVAALVAAIAQHVGLEQSLVLEEFGEFLTPDLLRMYGSLLKPEWRTLDVIEHTEGTIHRVVRMREKAARPPELVCMRRSPGHVTISYRSERRLCAIAKGIVRGLARHFNEAIEIQETSCMLHAASSCEIQVRPRKPGAPVSRPIL